MSRLSAATRDTIPKEQTDHFEDLLKNYGKVPGHGPAYILAHVPKAWRLEQDLREYLRNESSLSDDVIELTMLVAAREFDCQLVWNAHAELARKAGVAAAVVDALREDDALPAMRPEHLAVIQFGRESLRDHRVAPGTYLRAKEQFGERGIVELGLLFGSYCTLAILLNGTDAELPANGSEPLLPVS